MPLAWSYVDAISMLLSDWTAVSAREHSRGITQAELRVRVSVSWFCLGRYVCPAWTGPSGTASPHPTWP